MTLLAILFVAATVVLLAVVFVAVRLGDPPPPAVQRVFFHDRIIWVDHLSYSNEGHVPREQLINGLSEAGTVSLHEIKTIGRYRPNAQASANADTVDEFVIEIQPIEPVSPRPQAHRTRVSP